MHGSKSYDNLSDALKGDTKPAEKKKGLLTRLRNFRKTHIRKSPKDKRISSDSSSVKTNLSVISRENSLTASISMPDIAGE